MIRRAAARAIACAALIMGAAAARAQPDPAPLPAPAPPIVVPSPPAPTPPVAASGPRWTTWTIQAVEPLLEHVTTVRALLETTMTEHPVIDDAAREAIAQAAEAIGYHLIGLGVSATGVATLSLAPIPVVRSVVVSVPQGFFDVVLNGRFEDQIQRRLRVRTGAKLPWDPGARAQALVDEGERVEEYLHDEGFFEATARLSATRTGKYGFRVEVDVALGPAYKIGVVTVETGGGQGVSVAEIKETFVRQRECIVWRLCLFKARFTRALHVDAKAKVQELYRKRGYPAARVQSDFDPRISFDRKSQTVRFTIRVDERRQIDVVFEGNDKGRFSDEDLRKQLTFNEAASADDFEAASSAAALVELYQSRGKFDAQVTWTRERFTAFDRIVFRIDEGESRQVRSVTFAGNHALTAGELAGGVTTRVHRTIRVFASNPAATATVLADDVDRLRRTYAARGYLEARIAVHASPDRDTLDSAALTGATLAANRRRGDLHIRFEIGEGPRTDVAEVQLVAVHDPKRELVPEVLSAAACEVALVELLKKMKAEPQARRTIPNGCAATLDGVPFQEDGLRAAGDGLRDWFWQQGRPRTGVELKVDPGSVKRHRAVLRYEVALGPQRHLGKVIVRGNFRTRRSVILDELGFDEGAQLTSSLLASGPRAVRATGLFEAVNIELLDLDSGTDAPVHAVVRVEERYDARAQVDLEGGYSSLSAWFVKGKGALPNLSGTGIYFDLSGTYGGKYTAVEASGRIPRWLANRLFPVAFDTELTGYLRSQETDRFGLLTTVGFSVGATRSWQLPGTDTRRPSVIATSLRYDFRIRNRDEDALRPAGVDVDQVKVPVQTKTGSLGIGLRYDSRVDYRGQYNPLAAEAGVLLDATVSLASPYLAGQDTFIKASAMAQRFWPIGKRIVIRTDARVDEGFPLGGSVLLPEVERFFAGGDNTVRGFDEDRLATEIIETMVPPIDGLQQIRVLPAGGNIRAVASIDGQLLLVERWLASALFVDAGMVRNRWSGITASDIRPGVGTALRILTPFGTITLEYAFPVFPKLGDDPRGRLHFGLAFRQ